jgi:hypothetical protein
MAKPQLKQLKKKLALKRSGKTAKPSSMGGKTPQQIEDETLVMHTSGGEMPDTSSKRKPASKSVF